MASRVAAGLQLLEVGEIADVDLGGEVPPDRLLERLPRLEPAARKRPSAEEGLLRALPEQHLQDSLADLEDRAEGLVGRPGLCGRLGHKVID
jgi:hypothetical protein